MRRVRPPRTLVLMPRPQRKAPPYDVTAVASLLLLQSGLVTRAQLAGAGATLGDLQRALRCKALIRLEPGVYVNHNGPLSSLQRAWWACLHYGPGALIDRSAVELARAADGSRLTFPLTIGISHGRTPGFLEWAPAVRVSRIDEFVAWNARPARMRPEVAALRWAAAVDDHGSRISALTDAVNWRTTRADRLQVALADLPRLPHRSFLLELVADLSAGTCSVLEREYLHRVERAHGLPGGQRQAARRSADGVELRDVLYELFRLVVELDGRAFHSGKRAWARDHERDLDDLVDGRESARLGWEQVFDRPCGTARKLGLVFRSRGWEGAPVRCGAACTVGA